MGLKRHRELASEPRFSKNRWASRTRSLKPLQFSWADAISRSEWRIYRSAIGALRKEGIEFLVGGGFARAGYIGHWRDTKDIDFYLRPGDRQRARRALTTAGFDDYYQKLPYDRAWIYRSYKKNVIVDVIWAMANQRAAVDDDWFQYAPRLSIHGERVLLIPPEELLWCKLYIIQRDRCDWTDIFNLVREHGSQIDWSRLIRRAEQDVPLLEAMLTVYEWLCPSDARKLPASLSRLVNAARRRMRSRPPTHDRIRLLDNRLWFTGRTRKNQKLEI
jgi:hypothetical protein